MHGEVIKQVQVKSTKYMLHASIIAIGIILAVLYNDNTPYQIARGQSRYLTTKITSRHLEGPKVVSLPERVEARVIEEIEKTLSDLDHDYSRSPRLRGRSGTSQTGRAPYSFLKQATNSTDKDHRFGPPRHTRKWIYGRPERIDRSSEPLEFAHFKNSPGTKDIRFDKLDNSGMRVDMQGELVRQFGFEIPAPGQLRPVDGLPKTPSRWQGPGRALNPAANEDKTSKANAPEGAEAYASHVSAPVASRRSRELYYACLLIPRFLSTPITLEVRNMLTEEMGNIFLSNGWKLESLVIDKDSMQWVGLLPSTIAPAKHIKVVREATTSLVTPFFMKLTNHGLLRDFWAPGQLLESGNELISRYEIDEFIENNRRQYYPGVTDDGAEVN